MTNGFITKRFSYVLDSYLRRWKRLWSHLFFQKSVYRIPLDKWYDWPMDLLFYVIDIFFISDVADILMNGLKTMRQLSETELELVHSIFENSVDVSQIFIWEKARPLKKGLYHAFVSFNTIQSIKPLRLPILIHEVVHVWQYQRFGVVYIYRALKAQQSKNGYDYGGEIHLKNCLQKGKELISFNFEQQAQIIEDFVKKSLSKKEQEVRVGVYTQFVKDLNYLKTF